MNDELNKREIKDFTKVYLGFVYRLAVGQYEEDYQEMRKIIEEDRRHYDEYGTEPDYKLVNEKIAKNRDLEGIENREKRVLNKDNTHSTKVPASIDNHRHDVFYTDDTDNRYKSGRYSYLPPSQLGKGRSGQPRTILRSDNKSPKIRRPDDQAPQKSSLATPAEQLEFLKEAEQKKRQLERELQMLESSINKTRLVASQNNKQHQMMTAPIRESSYEEEKGRGKKTSENSVDYRRENRGLSEDRRKYSGVSSALKSHPIGSNYHEAESISHPKYYDNAEFIRRLNREKKEREVGHGLCR